MFKDLQNKNKFYCNKLINNFDNYVCNLNKITKICSKISKIDAKSKNIATKYKFSFMENSRLGQLGIVFSNEHKIIINITRLRLINQRKIETDTEKGLKKFLDFKNEFYKIATPSLDDGVLFGFLHNKNWQNIYSSFGNYKLLPWQLLQTIFHENQHIVQIEYENDIINSNNVSVAKETLYLLFVCLYNKIYNILKDTDNLQNYVRKNEFFPIEIDAEYITLNIIKDLLKDKNNDAIFIIWKNFTNRLKDIETANIFAETIFNDFIYLSNIYEKIGDNNFAELIKLVKENKSTILASYKKIYQDYEQLNTLK